MSSRPELDVTGSTVWACQKVVEYLKPKLEGDGNQVDKVASVERHIGRFDKPEEIKRWLSNRDGGVRVATVRVQSAESEYGRIFGVVDFAAYVFTSDMWAYEKDQRAEVIVGAIMRELLTNGALPDAQAKPMNVRADNLYSGDIDKIGVAIWSVTWSQKWALDVPIDPSTLDDFIRFGLRGEIADGAPEIEGVVTLPQS